MNLTWGIVFNCIDVLLCFVVWFELFTFINFAVATQHVALDYVDMRDREGLFEILRQSSTQGVKICAVNCANLLHN